MLRPVLLRPGLLRLARLPWISAGLLLALLTAADTDAGRDLLARAVTAVSGGQVVVQGIGGELPLRPRIGALTLTDRKGAWLRAEGLALMIRPAALLRGELDIRALAMDKLEVLRGPVSGEGDGVGLRLPFPVRLRELVIAQLVPTALPAPVPPLAVTGGAAAAGRSAEADLLLTVPGQGHQYRLRLAADQQGTELAAEITEQADGPLAAMARVAGVPLPPAWPGWRLSAQASGPPSAASVATEIAVGQHRADLSGVIDLPGRRIAALDAQLEIAGMAVGLPGAADAVAWERVTARAELSGALLAPDAVVRTAVTGLSWRRAATSDAITLAGDLALDGRIDWDQGPRIAATLVAAPAQVPAPWGGLLGPAPSLSLLAERQGQRWSISDGRLDIALLRAAVSGHLGGPAPDPRWALDLRLMGSRRSGVELAGSLRMASDALLPAGDVRIGMPSLKSALPGLLALLPAGSPLTPDAAWWRDIGGGLQARLTLAGADGIRLSAQGTGLQLPAGVGVGALALDGELRPPFGGAAATADLRLKGLRAAGVTGELDLRAEGPLAALALDASARLTAAGGMAGDIAGAGRLDTQARRLRLERLTLDTQDRRLRLLAPADLDFAAGLTLQSVRLGMSSPSVPTSATGGSATGGSITAGSTGHGDAALELTGRVTPRLDLDARLTDLDLAALAPWLPVTLGGVLDGRASLAGSLRSPTGSVSLDARGLTLGPAAAWGLPPAQARLTLRLERSAAQLTAAAWMDDRTRLTLDGRVGAPLWSPAAVLDLRGRGQADLALLAPRLGAGGRRADGRLRLDLGIAGTPAAPRFDGSLAIQDGGWRDARLGLWLEAIQGSLRIEDQGLRIERLTARAGDGTLALAGGMGWPMPGQPVDLRLRAQDAAPIQLDRLRLRGDADLSLSGILGEGLSLTGELRLARVDLRVPERLPADIPTLDVIELGERRQPRPVRRAAAGRGWRERLALDVRLAAPDAIHVSGRGIDAVLGGQVRLQGTAAAPAADGGFALLRGELGLVGEPLRFTRGRIVLDGGDLLDPTLDFEARAVSAGGTAILAVAGRAQAPELVLRGEPPMSDDEVLSRLLFGVPPGRLSAFQLTRLGLAAASFAGVGGDGRELLGRARSGLGLDRLRLGGDRRGGAAVEGGRQLTERVYLGAQQGVEGGEPRAVLRLQPAPRIRLESDVGAGGVGAGAAFELDY